MLVHVWTMDGRTEQTVLEEVALERQKQGWVYRGSMEETQSDAYCKGYTDAMAEIVNRYASLQVMDLVNRIRTFEAEQDESL